MKTFIGFEGKAGKGMFSLPVKWSLLVPTEIANQSAAFLFWLNGIPINAGILKGNFYVESH
jgi:hypothetical protein